MAHPLLHGVEGAPLEQVGCVHGVPGAAQLAGERVDARGQPLCVVEDHYLSHLHPSHLSPPLAAAVGAYPAWSAEFPVPEGGRGSGRSAS